MAGICNLGVQGDKLKSFLFIFDGPLDNQLGSGPWPRGSRVGAAEPLERELGWQQGRRGHGYVPVPRAIAAGQLCLFSEPAH